MLFYVLAFAQSANVKWLNEALYFSGTNGSWYQNQTANLSNAQDVLWAVRNYSAYNDVLWACRDIQDAATAAACLAFSNTTNPTTVTGTSYSGYNVFGQFSGESTMYTPGQGESGQSSGTSGYRERKHHYKQYPQCTPGAVTFTVGGLLKSEGSLIVLLFAVIPVTDYQDFYSIYNEAVGSNGIYGNATINNATIANSILQLTNGQPLDGIANITFDNNPCYTPGYTMLEQVNNEREQLKGNLTTVTSAFESLSGASISNWTNGANYNYNGTWTGSRFISNYTNGTLPAVGTVGFNASCGPIYGNPICGSGYCCSRTTYYCVGTENATDCLYY